MPGYLNNLIADPNQMAALRQQGNLFAPPNSPAPDQLAALGPGGMTPSAPGALASLLAGYGGASSSPQMANMMMGMQGGPSGLGGRDKQQLEQYRLARLGLLLGPYGG